MQTPKSSPLPRFDSPPVIETVLGIEFAPLRHWSLLHFGLYWPLIRDEFPTFKILPPIKNAQGADGKPQFRISSEPDVRCWYVSADGAMLLQLQRDRLVLNWRKSDENGVYPRYEKSIRPTFLREWNRFQEFVNANDLGELKPTNCEVSYINHLIKGREWNDVKDVPAIFPFFASSKATSFLPDWTDVAFEVNFKMPSDSGHLKVNLTPVVRISDGNEAFQLTLSAQGCPTKLDDESVLAWLDSAREWVVRGFDDLTSAKLHALWKKK